LARRVQPSSVQEGDRSMEARRAQAALALAVLLSCGAGYRSPNFVVMAPTQPFAQQVCQAAEHYRKSLAEEWLGRELPPWSQPCPITVRVGPQLGAGGVTSFMFERGAPFGWRMSIQGSEERVLDSVLPHEVTHTIFATHFGQPLPRWADEGACTTVEHGSERSKHYQHLYRFLTSERGIPFNQMFAMTEYPMDIMPLYAQGHSVVEYLIAQGGRRQFVGFLEEGLRSHDWDFAIRQHYRYRDLSDLQVRWVDWLRQGRPALDPQVLLASSTASSSGSSAPRGPDRFPGFLGRDAQVEQIASSASADSWYARQRGESSSQPDYRSATLPLGPQQAAVRVLQRVTLDPHAGPEPW
ncbi:MAG TPA: hypothetical protein VIY86_09970, partial [Pirellulaceae bacterium]